MNKRRRASSCPRRGPVGDNKDGSVEFGNTRPTSSRKKKKMDQVEICQELYDIIRTCKKEDETLLCEAFIRNPSRRQDPQYYIVVSKPIDLIRIQQKINRNIYEDIEELSADINLLVNNAKLFYKPDSEEYKDATNLWKLYNKHRQSLDTGTCLKGIKNISLQKGEEMKTSSSKQPDVAEDTEIINNEDDNVFEELFNAVMSENRYGYGLYEPFVFLPSEKKYPDYLEIVKSPIDLKTIAQKIQAREYTDLNDLEKDLLLMFHNACLYNEPDCQLYRDAETLKKVVQDCKQEIEQRLHGGTPAAPGSIRNKRARRLSAPDSRALAVMEPDKDEEPGDEQSEDSDDDILGNNTDNEDSPQWKLLETVWNHEEPYGTPIAQPFYKLPSRRDYADYYLKIKNPVSLKEIKTKIKRGCYGALSDMAEDMNIMFENAKEYNDSTSRLYKYAVKLQRLMQERVQELVDAVQISSGDDESVSSMQNQVQANTPRPRGRPSRSTSVGSKSNLRLKKKLHCVSKQLDKKNKSRNLMKHNTIWFVKNTINVNFH